MIYRKDHAVDLIIFRIEVCSLFIVTFEGILLHKSIVMNTFTKSIKTTFTLCMLMVSQNAYPQNVGIGTPTPAQKLHVAGAGQTIRVDGLSGVGTRDVYVNAFGDLTTTPGTPGTDWLTVGNAGTTAATNFIGTTDNIDFVVKTGGSAAANERIRTTTAGNVAVNNAAPFASDVFSVYAAGAAGAINALGLDAINGYASGANIGVYGECVGTTGWGVLGNTNTTSAGVQGQNNSGGDGVRGFNTSAAAGAGDGVYGQAAWNQSFGVSAFNTNATGTGIIGTGNNIVGAYLGNGSGGSFAGSAIGAIGFGETAVGGTGLIGVGNNSVTISTLAAGSGGAFTGAGIGLFSIANTAASGTGVLAVGNNLAAFSTLAAGSGVAANGLNFGIACWATSNANGAAGLPARAGGYFVSGTGATQTVAYVSCYEGGGVPRKIIGTGTVNTIVKNMNDQYVLFSAPEAPENLFQDYGTGSLVSGSAHITLDPVYAKNITVNESHPLRVFIQLEGDCKGVYVTNKTASGFEVKELNGGVSNVNFTWFVTANRGNETCSDGTVWHYAEERFAPTRGPQPVITQNKKSEEAIPISEPQNRIIKNSLKLNR
ncbi:MAG: hypothetical protein ACHQNT_13990 [Bacteroidia bacterium]